VRVGADSGGTFTDVVTADGLTTKVPSTPADPGAAVRTGIAQVSGDDAVPKRPADGRPELLAHGTTVATNALLERKVGRVALVTTEGFADVIEIARQDRPSLYDQWADRPDPLVARPDRIEARGRLGADGSELLAVDAATVMDPPEDADAVAVVLLHSDLDGSHERSVAAEIRSRGWEVTASHEVSPEFREYERTVTTVVNAALRPVCRSYLEGLAEAADDVAVMTSAGALVDVRRAADVPASLLLSGPAAGARAAAQVARACGFDDAVGFDMGGTSTDVCLVLGGEPAVAAQHDVAGFPVRLPSLDVHTVGAGGGSIARIDAGGALVVGPESAGAVPGPVCYRRGGTEPTVTDANLLLGRIPRGTAFSGLGELDSQGAADAMETAGVTAEGVVEVVNATMVQALRKVSVQRGVDPAGIALVAFGGAGPLHACELAEELGAAAVIVPAAAGVLSAMGLLSSPRGIELVRSWPEPLDHSGLVAAGDDLAASAVAAVGDPAAEVEVAFDCRYAGQSHELRVGSVDEFGEVHRRHNGYERAGDPVEVTAIRATATLPAPVSIEALCGSWEGKWAGETVVGPRVVSREDCTIWIPGGWEGSEGALGALVLRRSSPSPAGGSS